MRSSRYTEEGAGWHCTREGTFRCLLPKGSVPLSWLGPGPLVKSRNDVVARLFRHDPTNDERRRWVAAQAAAGVDPRLTVETFAGRDTVSFIVLGDTGEGDESQYCVVPGLLREAAGTDFMFIASDVIYPAGGSNRYAKNFYRPYKDYPGPIFAVPGNHDWYDGLTGFMRHFCDADGSRLPPAPGGPGGPVRQALLSLLWRRRPVNERRVARMRELRPLPSQRAVQPGPYFALEAGPLLLVGIDTGILGSIDRDQAAWLARVSRESPKPKILITGKPLLVNGHPDPGDVEGTNEAKVDHVVRDPANNYIATIGGDIHNYQRYPVRLEDGRTIQYIVSGGGGAFMHGTHRIPKVELPGVVEGDFRLYPLRCDSLSIFSQIYQRRLGFLLGHLFIPPNEAAGLIAEHLGIPITRRQYGRSVPVSPQSRRAFGKVFDRLDFGHGLVHEYAQHLFDLNDPPMFKSFLRIDASASEVLIRCIAATGCLPAEEAPPVEDAARATLQPDGRWAWRSETP